MARMWKLIFTFWEKLLATTGGIGIGLLLMLAIFITLQVVARYIFNTDIRGLFAYSVSALIIFPLLASAYTLKYKEHIAVDFLTSRLSQRAKVSLSIPAYLASLIFSTVLGYYSLQWTIQNIISGALKPVEKLIIPIPMGVLTGAMTLGLFLLAIETIRQLVSNIRFMASPEGRKREPHLGVRDNPRLFIALFIICTLFVGMVTIYVHPVIGLLLFVLCLLFSGLPVFMSLGLAGIFGLYVVLGNRGLLQAPITAFQATNNFPLSALPLFIVGGMILESALIIDKVFKVFQMFSGRFAASPLLATIAVGGFFCAITGSTTAATAVIAAVVMPILIKQGYRKTLACGVVGGSTVGTLIPPSIGFIIYGVITGESIGQLFFGGMMPAVVLFSFYFLYVILRSLVSKKSLYERGEIPPPVTTEHYTRKELFSLFGNAFWGLITPVFVLGGIYLGIFTPTEAAAVMVVYAIIVTTIITRTLSVQGLMQALKRSTFVSAMLLCILIGALILAAVVSQLRIGPNLATFAVNTGLGPLEVLGIIFVMLFILGMFLNAGSVMMITLPVFFPVTQAVGIDPLWLGVFYIIVLETGCLTPPVGTNIFAISGASRLPMYIVVLGNAPFVGMMLLTLVCIFIFPELVTWLPGTMIQ